MGHETPSSGRLKTDGLQAFNEPCPRRSAAVVLLHGLCSTPDELRMAQARLQALGYTTCALSIEGYSFDPHISVQCASPFASWIDAIERQVETLRRSHQVVVLVGISAGASLALGAAIRCGSRIDALVLMSTSLLLDGRSLPMLHFLLPLALYTPLGRFWKYRERAPYGVKNERTRAWIERELRARRISRAGSSTIGVAHLRENDRLVRHVRSRLAQVECKAALALHALEDEVASSSNADWSAASHGARLSWRTAFT